MPSTRKLEIAQHADAGAGPDEKLLAGLALFNLDRLQAYLERAVRNDGAREEKIPAALDRLVGSASIALPEPACPAASVAAPAPATPEWPACSAAIAETILPATPSRSLLRRPADILVRGCTALGALLGALALLVAAATSRALHGDRGHGRLGPYTLLEKLGEGGMGEVYLARHAMLERPTAVKVLPPDRFDAESLARFEAEVQLTARLTHPNTVRVYDYGQTRDGIFYYAMECLDGATLADLVKQTGPMPAARVIHVLDQIAGALSEAHRAGLVHCDIKPANIVLTEQGGVPDTAKLLDFGLVEQIGARAARGAHRITGTPLYMAPEAISTPDAVDARSDLYALGAVGYFLMTGHDVFTGRTLLEVCGHHLHSTPVPPSRRVSSVPADLEAVILACLEKDPQRRPAGARELQRALRACAGAGSWSEEDARACRAASRADSLADLEFGVTAATRAG